MIKGLVEDENKIETVISDDITFRGSLKFKNSLKLKCTFEGKIESDGHLTIGREATISADINANIVSVNGNINGRIKAEEKIFLFSKSKTRGDIISSDIYMENGASFNGTCIMEEKNS